MTTTTQTLTGIIFTSMNPERLAAFYRDVLDIPFALAQHGKIREHIECEVNHIHFAILKKGQIAPTSNITPSFRVNDLAGFIDGLAARSITPLHPIIDLGEGKRVSTIADPDGNTIRLIQIDYSISHPG
jgi:predicted enzyme related to lactoylglutathione lyase